MGVYDFTTNFKLTCDIEHLPKGTIGHIDRICRKPEDECIFYPSSKERRVFIKFREVERISE